MKPLTKWLAVLGVLALLVFTGFRVQQARTKRALANAPPPTEVLPVQVTQVQRRDVVERLSMTGVIRPHNEVDVFPRVPGRVQEVLVKVGDKVKQGQTLAVIEHREIALQNLQAQSQMEALTASLESARSNFETTRLQYERYQALRKQNAISQADFERIEAGYQAAAAGVRAAEAQNRAAKASHDLAGEALRNSRIVAPIAGSVTRRTANLGTQVSPMQPIFQIQDVATLKLDGSVSAGEYSRLQVSQPASVTVDELPRKSFVGKLATLSPTLDPMTRRAAVEVEIENSEGALLPNMFANATLVTGKREGALVIPANAVVALPGRKVVYVVRNGKAAAVSPVLGGADGDLVVVESGLSEGDQVVTKGHEALSDGAAVKVVSEPDAQAEARR